MSEQLIKEDADIEGIEEQKPSRLKKYIIFGALLFIVIIVVIIVIIMVNKSGNSKDNSEDKSEDKSKDSDYADLTHEIITVKFPPDIKYIGSHYNYQGQLFLTYQKNTSENYFFGIADDNGNIFKEIIEVTSKDLDITYIQRASSFDDGKRVLIGGKILECEKKLVECD